LLNHLASFGRTKEARWQACLRSVNRLRLDQPKTPVKWLQVKGWLKNLKPLAHEFPQRRFA